MILRRDERLLWISNAIIDQILEADKLVPKKQRHTSN